MSRLRLLLMVMALGLLAACKDKSKKAVDEDRPLTFSEFGELFPADVELPYKLTTDVLKNKIPDSLALKPKVVQQFFPDTLTSDAFPAKEKVRIYPLAYFKNSNLHYAVIKAVGKSGTGAYICLFSPKGELLNKKLAGQIKAGVAKEITAGIDSRYNIKVNMTEKRSASFTAIREETYGVNPDGSMVLIVANTNEPVNANGIVNPIDTLPRKHKLSGDYTAGEGNLVSIRDGEMSKEFQFYMVLSKNKGECAGELDGTGRFTSATTGQYRDKNSPCILEFRFSAGRVIISETNCGAYRGIGCKFEGSYVKKKETKKKS